MGEHLLRVCNEGIYKFNILFYNMTMNSFEFRSPDTSPKNVAEKELSPREKVEKILDERSKEKSKLVSKLMRLALAGVGVEEDELSTKKEFPAEVRAKVGENIRNSDDFKNSSVSNEALKTLFGSGCVPKNVAQEVIKNNVKENRFVPNSLLKECGTEYIQEELGWRASYECRKATGERDPNLQLEGVAGAFKYKRVTDPSFMNSDFAKRLAGIKKDASEKLFDEKSPDKSSQMLLLSSQFSFFDVFETKIIDTSKLPEMVKNSIEVVKESPQFISRFSKIEKNIIGLMEMGKIEEDVAKDLLENIVKELG